MAPGSSILPDSMRNGKLRTFSRVGSFPICSTSSEQKDVWWLERRGLGHQGKKSGMLSVGECCFIAKYSFVSLENSMG